MKNKKLSKALKEYWNSKEGIERRKIQSVILKEQNKNLEFKEKLKERMIGNKLGCFQRTDRTKKKISEARKGMKFSDEHRKNISNFIKGRVGKDSRNWQGGISKSRPGEVTDWSRKVRNRDGYTCQLCGDTNYKGRGKSIKLCSHHIKSWKDYPEYRYDVENGITLCHDCHWWVHRTDPINQQ